MGHDQPESLPRHRERDSRYGGAGRNTPTVRAALMAAGGRPAVINSIGGRINLVVSEWPSLAAVEPQRAKAYRIIRQYIVEMRA